MRLEFPPTSLYGRESELELAVQLVHQIQQEDAPAQTCIVYGVSGCGKTQLCQAVQHQVDASVFFIRGKFDQNTTSVPYSGIAQAVESLVQCISNASRQEQHEQEEDAKAEETIATVLREGLAYEGRMLTKLVSGFQDFLGDSEQSEQDTQQQQDTTTGDLSFCSIRLAVAMSSFLERFCSPERPMVLCIDDLHNADPHSVQVLQHLMHSSNLTNLLFLGGIRDAPDNNSRILLKQFLDLPRVSSLFLDNLSLDHLHLWIADLLGANNTLQETLELAKVCHKKTQGNPYFVRQFLQFLETQGLLQFNVVHSKWQWAPDLVFETDVADNVVDVLTRRIQTLPPSVRRLLQLASCVGFVIDMELLRGLHEMEQRHHMLVDADTEKEEGEIQQGNDQFSDFKTSWHIAETEGMVELSDTGLSGKFSHDRVHQCAYELVPEGKTRQLLHLRIGKYIRDKYLGNPLYLFRAADQLNRGSALVLQDTERFELIQLNLQASRLARTQSGMDQVANLLHNAIALHEQTEDHSKWAVDYDLILEVYSFSSEVEFSRGRFDLAQERIQTIANRARDPADTIRSRTVTAQMLGVQLNFGGAMEETLSVLDFMGTKLPAATTFNIIREMQKTQKLLRGKSDMDLTSLPKTTNERIRTVMHVLYLTSIYGFNADFKLAALTYLRMMQLTLQHGICEWSPYAFVVYGLLLAGKGQYQEAFRLSQLAQQLQRNDGCFPAYCLMANTFLAHVKLPLPECLEPSLRAYRLGLETGDVMSGGLCLSVYAVMYLMVGLPLAPLTEDLKRFGAQIRLFQLDLPLTYILPLSQLALNLSGQTFDPLTISWESISSNHLSYDENISAGYPHRPADIILFYCQIFNAFLLRDTNKLEESVKAVLALKTRRLPGDTAVFNYFAAFVDGLAGFELYRKRRKRVYKKLATKAIQWLVFNAKKGCVNVLGMLRLLEAEKKTLGRTCGTEHGRKLYDEAISQLSRSGFTNLCAIANELAGEFSAQRGDRFWPEENLPRAVELYEEWGAKVKVEQMRTQHGCLRRRPDRVTNTSFRGRQRFEDITRKSSSASKTNEILSGDKPNYYSSGEMSQEESNILTAECCPVNKPVPPDTKPLQV